ncbi:hypothetical protein FQA47_020878 [Oryzias melastigma]|uniref:Uncharacterized protein n=1 Tax=Oryzias melastigma TaxID=30732 RepID=A0A834FB68_ORYME|nr:hypothetical protein FQA47_020878 [Oryzias melastigma]
MDGTEPQIRQKSEFVPRHGGERGNRLRRSPADDFPKIPSGRASSLQRRTRCGSVTTFGEKTKKFDQNLQEPQRRVTTWPDACPWRRRSISSITELRGLISSSSFQTRKPLPSAA